MCTRDMFYRTILEMFSILVSESLGGLKMSSTFFRELAGSSRLTYTHVF